MTTNLKCVPLLVMALALPSIGVASPQDCVALEDDSARLACFDAAFQTEDLNPEEPESRNAGEWSVRIETSEMTDQTNVFLSVESDQPVNCGWNGGGRPVLFLRCLENTTSIIFATDCHMTSSRYDSYGDITYRLDDETPQTYGFTQSTNNRSLGLWNGSTAIPFIREMLDNDRLLARMTPFGENPFEVSFDISGLDVAIEPLRDACSW